MGHNVPHLSTELFTLLTSDPQCSLLYHNMGQSKFTATVKMRISKEVLEQIEESAKTRELTASDIIREALREYVERNRPASPMERRVA